MELPIASAFRNRQWQSAIAMGQVYDSAGDRARAREFYAAALADLDSQRRLAPDDYQVHAAKGLTFAGLGRADEAVRHGSKAVDLLPVSRDAAEGPVYLYALAAIHARLGQHGEAFNLLDRMFAGPSLYSEHWIHRDPWFESVRADPRFAEQLGRWSRQKGTAIQ